MFGYVRNNKRLHKEPLQNPLITFYLIDVAQERHALIFCVSSKTHCVKTLVIDLNVRRKLSVDKPGVEHWGQKNVRPMFDTISTLESIL